MNELTVFNHNNIEVIDSREVAKMTGKQHKELLRDIHRYEEILENSQRKIAPSDFFIHNTFENRGKHYPCYLITKKGCDMVANKMTGEKGVLFTAAYVTAFDQMERRLTQPQLPMDYLSALRALVSSVEQVQQLQAENEMQRQAIADFQPMKQYVDTILSSPGTLATTQIAADYGMSAKKLNKILHEEGVQWNVNGQWVLCSKYMGKGYTKSETINITRSDGRPDTIMNTKWTQKGRLFLHELLTKRGIVALMDRPAS